MTTTTKPAVYDMSEGSSNTYTVVSPRGAIPPCIYCEEWVPVKFDGNKYATYFLRDNPPYARNLWPDLDAGLVELVISGTHPECWGALFADMIEDDA